MSTLNIWIFPLFHLCSASPTHSSFSSSMLLLLPSGTIFREHYQPYRKCLFFHHPAFPVIWMVAGEGKTSFPPPAFPRGWNHLEAAQQWEQGTEIPWFFCRKPPQGDAWKGSTSFAGSADYWGEHKPPLGFAIGLPCSASTEILRGKCKSRELILGLSLIKQSLGHILKHKNSQLFVHLSSYTPQSLKRSDKPHKYQLWVSLTLGGEAIFPRHSGINPRISNWTWTWNYLFFPEWKHSRAGRSKEGMGEAPAVPFLFSSGEKNPRWLLIIHWVLKLFSPVLKVSTMKNPIVLLINSAISVK